MSGLFFAAECVHAATLAGDCAVMLLAQSDALPVQGARDALRTFSTALSPASLFGASVSRDLFQQETNHGSEERRHRAFRKGLGCDPSWLHREAHRARSEGALTDEPQGASRVAIELTQEEQAGVVPEISKASNSRRGAASGLDMSAAALIQSDEQQQEPTVPLAVGVVGCVRCQRRRLGSEGKATQVAVVRPTAGISLRGGATVARRPHKPKAAGSIPALATKEGGCHVPTPPKAGPLLFVCARAESGRLNTETLFTYGAHGGLFASGKDWVAGGRAGSAALTPPALHAPVAQSEEHPPCKGTVRGSNPRVGSTESVRHLLPNRRGGRLESSCLGTKGIVATDSADADDGGKTPRSGATGIQHSENDATETRPKLPLGRVQVEVETAGETAHRERIGFDGGQETSLIVLAGSVRHEQPANVNRERQLGTRSRPRGVNGVERVRRSSSAFGVSTRAGLQRARVGAVVEIRCGGGGAAPGAGLSRLKTDYARERDDVSSPADRGSIPRASSTSTEQQVTKSREHLGRARRRAPVSECLTDSSVSQRRAEQPAQLRRAG